MTRDDIIRMAREAGLGWVDADAQLERFAALVATAEREACARLCETPIDEIQITDDISEFRYMDAQECAAAIRARGEK